MALTRHNSNVCQKSSFPTDYEPLHVRELALEDPSDKWCCVFPEGRNNIFEARVTVTYECMYLQLVKVDLSIAEPTAFQSTLAFVFQVLRKISFPHQHATLRMYTGDF